MWKADTTAVFAGICRRVSKSASCGPHLKRALSGRRLRWNDADPLKGSRQIGARTS